MSQLRFLLVISIIIISMSASGKSQNNGEIEIYYEDLVITNETYLLNRSIILNGNLIVKSGANLTLDNVTLKINSLSPDDFLITVEAGGKLNILNLSLKNHQFFRR
ncbi:MAG: hypothetical protein AB1779_01690, partial [Candidatus Thermoplasmatota archaeon]